MTETKVTKVIDIDKKFVKAYYTEHREARAWIAAEMRKQKEKRGRKYFAPFRTEFARQFLPELFSTRKKEKLSFLDELLAIE
ncbi:MAG: hypothetical protein IJV48_04055 [Ruminococcus sp.]|nr:hypothetical protein [Ruminococcus sp.]